MQTVRINALFITLGQLLKEESIIESGGQAKWFLRENTVLVNDEPEDRRGRKLYSDDTVTVTGEGTYVVQSQLETTD
ncbi:S4 domain-containing protein YaaA [Lactiplantibacillus mudanjiangensis]|uniref:RNA-binding protein [Lactobacillus koreensis] n=1 Tax=Lactiplantibacillus mudanjiangensis TaxID=1296538 RepID=A0A660DTP9_9LACO|nr:S4 domain-containing protein YaaA [Lactiplantibacillus mudanjiangensis]VDG20909.1 RNA-binding protein [Lactobacillus koreensis] [Lactiplantibacillus mudanjiangensis]VDG22640.1 RNA-binding protein [Lactobacillus koreensis] [Lactiplantibacillus mudanjiangensis]VDG26818.1 RNA-binding protein [Lactobacillus koreensis] [Lactiplantibacillus mudanjiangensis]VDG31961.1 RNA-binding protein [Lactobacillus koreensis] [Lactiplantibacillus mudanjiangensis]